MWVDHSCVCDCQGSGGCSEYGCSSPLPHSETELTTPILTCAIWASAYVAHYAVFGVVRGGVMWCVVCSVVCSVVKWCVVWWGGVGCSGVVCSGWCVVGELMGFAVLLMVTFHCLCAPPKVSSGQPSPEECFAVGCVQRESKRAIHLRSGIPEGGGRRGELRGGVGESRGKEEGDDRGGEGRRGELRGGVGGSRGEEEGDDRGGEGRSEGYTK